MYLLRTAIRCALLVDSGSESIRLTSVLIMLKKVSEQTLYDPPNGAHLDE